MFLRMSIVVLSMTYFRDVLSVCDNQRCNNRGVCKESKSLKFCECVRGFSGERCETSRNFCEDNSCANGSNCT